jgi:catechol 2,3-dioxygenase-like lactoylglutathione lyase family enzyme
VAFAAGLAYDRAGGKTMHINGLDHVNIRTTRYDGTLAFYRDVIGLTVTVPPGRKTVEDGAWICDESARPIVHLVRAGQAVSALGAMDLDNDAATGTGPLHHVALDCADYDGFRRHLDSTGLEVGYNDIPEVGIRQIFVRDPNGLLVELNFR